MATSSPTVATSASSTTMSPTARVTPLVTASATAEDAVQQRLKLKQTPIDTWTLKEQLCLASSVLKSGDQNWVSVSRVMRQFGGEAGRPADWFSQKNCALQYNLLLEKIDNNAPKRKRGGKSEGLESPGEAIVRKLREERMNEIRAEIEKQTLEMSWLEEEINLLAPGSSISEEKLNEISRRVMEEDRLEEERKEKERRDLEEREEKKLAIAAALKTAKMPYYGVVAAAVARRESTSASSEIKTSTTTVATTATTVTTTAITPHVKNAESSDGEKTHKVESSTSPQLTSLLLSPSQSSTTDCTDNKKTPSSLTTTEKSVKKTEKSVKKTEEEEVIKPSSDPPKKESIKEEKKDEEEEKEVSKETEESKESSETAKKEEEKKVDEKKEEETNNPEETLKKEEEEKKEGEKKTEEDKEKHDGDAAVTAVDINIEEDKKEIVSEKETKDEPKKTEEKKEAPVIKEETIISTEITATTTVPTTPTVTITEPKRISTRNSTSSASTPASGRTTRAKKSMVDDQDEDDLAATPKGQRTTRRLKKNSEKSEVEVEEKKEEPMALPPTTIENRRLSRIKDSETVDKGGSNRSASSSSCTGGHRGSVASRSSSPTGQHGDDSESDSVAVRSTRLRRRSGKIPNVNVDSGMDSVPASPASAAGSSNEDSDQQQPAWKRRMYSAINEIRALGCQDILENPEYPEGQRIVLRPTDLSTIRRNVESGSVKSITEFHRDINFLLLNILMITSMDSEIYEQIQSIRGPIEQIMTNMATISVEKTGKPSSSSSSSSSSNKRKRTSSVISGSTETPTSEKAPKNKRRKTRGDE